ncbi:DinB family protein [Rhodospirillum centenum]|uniref:DinB family protein n=1 Tax=Rhodospirillum centenum (strain ATCC 51521 / SW) TaxID=414684 RepID=B6IPD6_RHOCS|nr:DinB family protein [Rhodospirillum centenum]ACI99638.1 DinB family protein [Rhodospirillum centenum SW]
MPAAMITPAYVRTMAAYNAEMNRRIYAAAGRLGEAERRRDRGAFWGSIHGTLSHLLWGDRMWMSRFDGWEKPTQPLKQSGGLHDDFAALTQARAAADEALCDWAGRLEADWLAGEQRWYSGAAGREMAAPRGFLLAHMFNHQTHHRGQVHVLLTQAGQDPGDTDLFLLPPLD